MPGLQGRILSFQKDLQQIVQKALALERRLNSDVVALDQSAEFRFPQFLSQHVQRQTGSRGKQGQFEPPCEPHRIHHEFEWQVTYTNLLFLLNRRTRFCPVHVFARLFVAHLPDYAVGK